MTAIIDRKPLAAALKLLGKVTERRNTIPVCSTLRLKAEAGRVSLLATDLDLELEMDVAAETVAPFALLVNTHTLRDTVAKMKATRVQLVQDGARLIVSDASGAGAAARIAADIPLTDFPRLEARTTAETFAVDAAQFRDDSARAMVAVSCEETRYYLNGIFWHFAGGNCLNMATTDGHRLVRIARPRPAALLDLSEEAQTAHPLAPGVIIPRKAVATLIDVIGKDAGGDIAFEFGNTHFIATRDGMTLRSKIVDGTFPDYSRVIPQTQGRGFNIDGDALADAVNAVTAHCSGKAPGVGFRGDAAGLTIGAADEDNGIAGAQLAGVVLAPPFKVGDAAEWETGFNSVYVKAIATKVFDGATLEWRFEDASSAALITSPAFPYITAVQMPLRGCACLTVDAVRGLNGQAPVAEPEQAPQAASEPVAVSDAPAPVAEPVTAPEPEPAAVETVARPAWIYDESCHFAAGHKAATQGQPRALPSYFTTHHGQNARDWFRGFDLAAAEAVAIVETPADIAPEGDADVIAALDAEKAARLARASAAAVEALEADGVTDPLSAGCDYIWPRFVTTYLGLQHQRDWHFEGTGKQRDRKARNHGAVMISPAMHATIRAHFEALAPFQPAAVVEVEPVALPAPSPEPAAAAFVADDISATVASLAARVAALEGAATGKRVRSDREARAIVRAWRMRAQIRAARADAAQARANEAATRAQLQAQAREAMRLEETVEQLRSAVTDAEVRAHRIEQEADGLRTALAAAQSDLAAARADMDSLAPLADVLASFAQRRAATPALPTGAAG